MCRELERIWKELVVCNSLDQLYPHFLWETQYYYGSRSFSWVSNLPITNVRRYHDAVPHCWNYWFGNTEVLCLLSNLSLLLWFLLLSHTYHNWSMQSYQINVTVVGAFTKLRKATTSMKITNKMHYIDNLLFQISSICFGRCFRPPSGALDCICSIL